jgi:hypothetical protein
MSRKGTSASELRFATSNLPVMRFPIGELPRTHRSAFVWITMETFAPGQLVQHACSIIQAGYLYGISERISSGAWGELLTRAAAGAISCNTLSSCSLFLKTSSMMCACTQLTQGISIRENADSPNARRTLPTRCPTRASAPQHTAPLKWRGS